MKLLKKMNGTSIYQLFDGGYLVQNDINSETRISTLQAYALFYAMACNAPSDDLLYKIANR